MSFGNRPRREGKAQWEAHDRQQNKGRRSCAMMRDGSIVQIESLAHQVDLAASRNVARFCWTDEIRVSQDGM